MAGRPVRRPGRQQPKRTNSEAEVVGRRPEPFRRLRRGMTLSYAAFPVPDGRVALLLLSPMASFASFGFSCAHKASTWRPPQRQPRLPNRLGSTDAAQRRNARRPSWSRFPSCRATCGLLPFWRPRRGPPERHARSCSTTGADFQSCRSRPNRARCRASRVSYFRNVLFREAFSRVEAAQDIPNPTPASVRAPVIRAPIHARSPNNAPAPCEMPLSANQLAMTISPPTATNPSAASTIRRIAFRTESFTLSVLAAAWYETYSRNS